jgi:hypothetical protein
LHQFDSSAEQTLAQALDNLDQQFATLSHRLLEVLPRTASAAVSSVAKYSTQLGQHVEVIAKAVSDKVPLPDEVEPYTFEWYIDKQNVIAELVSIDKALRRSVDKLRDNLCDDFLDDDDKVQPSMVCWCAFICRNIDD